MHFHWRGVQDAKRVCKGFEIVDTGTWWPERPVQTSERLVSFSSCLSEGSNPIATVFLFETFALGFNYVYISVCLYGNA